MKFKSEFTDAVKLFLLLSMLFWSFTWNSSEYFEFSRADFQYVHKASDDITLSSYQFSSLFDSPVGYYESGKPIESDVSIPLFYEWKEKEMAKYEKGSSNDGSLNDLKNQPVRRKLNYASSKCGAKVLASNPEARHRASVLSEKFDEYLLNPCRARTWFVVELCDTVEANQFELANYELYSSSPKDFSVFWSDVYPGADWHLLGNFEAKDQRTMQTFDVTAKNFGKFIKVVLHTHHGKEHYCPLSVIRVLGYSMVEKYGAIGTSGSSRNLVDASVDQPDKNEALYIEKQSLSMSRAGLRDTSYTNLNIFSTKECPLLLMHYCAYAAEINNDTFCSNEPMCRFLLLVMFKSFADFQGTFCSGNMSRNSSAIYEEESGDNLDLSDKSTSGELNSPNVTISSNCEDISKTYERQKSVKIAEKIVEHLETNCTRAYLDATSNAGTEKVHETSAGGPCEKSEKCVCVEKPSIGQIEKLESSSDVTVKESSKQVALGAEDAVESAGLIHTDSVIFKLTARIKALELDLNLINKYLQRLSQSYRHQMTDMKSMFDLTLRAIDIQSENAKRIDKKQHQSISALEKKLKVLAPKIDFLISGQRDSLKRVVELHGFFLALELIVVSTLFTLFLNTVHRKNNTMMGHRIKMENIWNQIKFTT